MHTQQLKHHVNMNLMVKSSDLYLNMFAHGVPMVSLVVMRGHGGLILVGTNPTIPAQDLLTKLIYSMTTWSILLGVWVQ